MSELSELNKVDFEEVMMEYPELNKEVVDQICQLYPDLKRRDISRFCSDEPQFEKEYLENQIIHTSSRVSGGSGSGSSPITGRRPSGAVRRSNSTMERITKAGRMRPGAVSFHEGEDLEEMEQF